jgi:hypothetical protein
LPPQLDDAAEAQVTQQPMDIALYLVALPATVALGKLVDDAGHRQVRRAQLDDFHGGALQLEALFGS